MISLNAHFDGKVIVPDTPLNLPAKQRVRISVEPIETAETSPKPKPVTFRKLIGEALKTPPNPNPRFPSDNDDVLWEDEPKR